MGILEAVKKGFAEAGKLMKVILIFFVFNVIVGLLGLPLTDPANAGNPGIVAMSAVFSIIFFLAFIYLQGGALGLVKDEIKTGALDLNRFMEYGKRFYLRILGLLLIYILIAIGTVLILALISAGLLLIGDNIFIRSIVAVIVTVVSLGIIVFLIFPIYSIVVDDTGPVLALKKGISVAKDNFVRILGLFLVMLVISLVISLVIGFLAGIVTIPLGDTVSRAILAIANSVVQSYIPVVMMIAFMSFYISMAAKTVEPQSGGQQPSGWENQ